MCIVGIQPEGYWNDDFKRVNIRVQAVFKLYVAAYLVVVQHVRLADGFDGGVHCRDGGMELFGDFPGGHPRFAEAQGLDVQAEAVAEAIRKADYAALVAEALREEKPTAKPVVAAYAMSAGIPAKGEYDDLLSRT